MRPKGEGILESPLYVTDVSRSAQFYEKIFGFRVISDFGGNDYAVKAGNRQVLLLFKKGGPRSIQSAHDGHGELHLGFAVVLSR
jgi:catechol 2,3-dioxygenase-like lactoylglutathione lyase family enzyme